MAPPAPIPLWPSKGADPGPVTMVTNSLPGALGPDTSFPPRTQFTLKSAQ